MDVGQLVKLVAKPEIHREVLGHYQGAYSLGVTRLDDNDKSGALRLRVENGKPSDFPSQINIHGEEVPVLVDVNWAAPQPQPAMAAAKS
jgi:hypothetical protein